MPFKKNQSGNILGKPKGAVNKTTKEIAEFVKNFVSSNLETIQTDLDSLEPKDRLLFIEKLLKFVLPTQIKHEINKEDSQGVVIIDWTGISDTELRSLDSIQKKLAINN